MSTPEIKICGITDPEIWDHCVTLGVNYLGLMLYAPSPRALSLEAAQHLRSRPTGDSQVVAVTVDASNALLESIASTLQPDFWQFHGDESPARLHEVRQRFGIPLIKALPIAEEADFHAVENYRTATDLLLFDAKPASGDTLPGGNARRFPWKLMREHNIGTPWFLAGGLNADNLSTAISNSGAARIDISSGVEKCRGIKSIKKISNLMQALQDLTLYSTEA